MMKIATGGPLPDRQSAWIAEKGPDLKIVNPMAAAIDIGSTMHMAAVNPEACDTPIRTLARSGRTCMRWRIGSKLAV